MKPAEAPSLIGLCESSGREAPGSHPFQGVSMPLLAHAARLCACLALALFSHASHSALGGQASLLGSEASSRKAVKMSAKHSRAASTGAFYSRYDMTLPDGGLITEFSDANGFVFAVSWTTSTMPDLSSLLGDHKKSVDAHQEASRLTPTRSARRLEFQKGDLRISSYGHLRSYRGQAYLASALPQGFDLSELSK